MEKLRTVTISRKKRISAVELLVLTTRSAMKRAKYVANVEVNSIKRV